jgi:hypothetical protein
MEQSPVKCIKESVVCNGYDNCEDKSDEDKELCRGNNTTSCYQVEIYDQIRTIRYCKAYNILYNIGLTVHDLVHHVEHNATRSLVLCVCFVNHCLTKESVVCNGYDNCEDKSDEDKELCRGNNTTSTRACTLRPMLYIILYIVQHVVCSII